MDNNEAAEDLANFINRRNAEVDRIICWAMENGLPSGLPLPRATVDAYNRAMRGLT